MSSGARGPAGAGPRPRAKRRRRAAEGLETAPDGTVIGQDPRRLTPVELRELGHRGKPLLQAMRRRCIDCCGGKKDEVRRCTAVACPLWPYRMGTDPWHAEPAKPAPERTTAVPAPAVPAAAQPSAAPVAEAKPAAVMKAIAPAATAPEPAARRRRAVAHEAAPEPAPPAPPAPAPQAAPPTPSRRRRRTAEAPLLPFLDDAPA